MAKLNIQDAYPGRSKKNMRKMIHLSFQNLGMAVLETAWLFKKAHRIEDLVVWKNEKRVFERALLKKGVVGLGSKNACWEVMFPAFTHHFPGVLITKKLKHGKAFFSRVIKPLRMTNSGELIYPEHAIDLCTRRLREGKMVCLADHRHRRQSKYWYPLFGIPAPTSLIPALLARRTASPVVVSYTRRTKGGFEILFSRFLFSNPQLPVFEDHRQLMDLVMHEIERAIRRRPCEWLWMYNRWRKGKPLPHYVRHTIKEAPIEI